MKALLHHGPNPLGRADVPEPRVLVTHEFPPGRMPAAYELFENASAHDAIETIPRRR